LPYDTGAYHADPAPWLAKADAYKHTQEVSFWAALNAKGEPAPQPAGSAITYDLTGLQSNTDYTFAMVSYDKQGNVSGISNEIHLTSGIEANAKKGGTWRLSLAGNIPNPFNPTTRIGYTVPGAAGGAQSAVKIGIYNLKGQLVKTLVNGTLGAGGYHVVWNGNDVLGKQVGSGVYFYRLTCAKQTLQKSMIYLR
jgi:hypothetical protein